MLTIEPNNGLEKYLIDQAYDQQIPISGTFELLPICNMNCRMCYVRLTHEEMKRHGSMLELDEWLRIAEEAREQGLVFVLLTGGEPLLYPQFAELYRQLRKMGMIVTINTNGTLINEEIVSLWKADLPRRVNISLYGSNDAIYEKLCDNPKGYTQTIRGIRMLQEAGIPVKLNYTLSKINFPDLENVARISEELELPVSMPTYMFPPARKRGLADEVDRFSRMSAKEAAAAQIAVLERAFGQEPDFKQRLQCLLDEMQESSEDAAPDKEVSAQMQQAQSQDLQQDTDKDVQQNSTQQKILLDPPGTYLCKAGVSSFWVNWRGDLTACGMIQQPFRNIRQGSFTDAWKEIQEQTRCARTSKKCFNCRFRKHCHTCAASALAETGNMEDEGTYNCELCEECERLLIDKVQSL